MIIGAIVGVFLGDAIADREERYEKYGRHGKPSVECVEQIDREYLEYIAPNGKQYERNDVVYLMRNGYSKRQAIKFLSQDEKYRK